MKCLLLVDIQNGFCSGGNLAVPNGEDIVPIVNRLIAKGRYDLVVASKDWHPADHGSFASQHPGSSPFKMGTLNGKPQMMWPDHCVQGSHDAEFHPGLNVGGIDHVQRKGEDPTIDSYSAFRDNDQSALTGLSGYLARAGIGSLDICGLATDYCVKASALDARAMLPGVKVRFISDASRGIDPTDVKAAIAEMSAAGVGIVTSADVLSER
ncbi:bifunctional nicotinamidase/pyrazinamidase [Pararhizobium sp. BT-229]|uniref:bifunctional nicotinamidase/pyrazinamidase n=1 Tax=Pararhizobium sp. BT-229 TaxID=2986923 RepID=UPI0021F767A8|nr:bifunctional nicotinamidase/pyrazinamidase [Pararhizobium sp. BT-229]MCV9960988.1 bifunctional nicotinamidase/pyrazinamidase [Pararhizobium sp. BT-229]